MTNVKNQYGVEINFETAVNLMNDDIREELHSEIAPCSEQEFFDEYCKRDVDFELAKENPVY